MKKLLSVMVLVIIFVFTSNQSFSQTTFKVVWKDGIILGILVPPTTTKEQLKDFIYKIRQGKKDKTLSTFLPPVTVGLVDKYRYFIVYVFTDPKWSTFKEYNNYKWSDDKSDISKAYVNQIVAYYEYTLHDKEYGSLGYDDGYVRSKKYKKLF